MLEVQVEPKYIYKRSHGSAEIRSLYRVLTAYQNQELLLSTPHLQLIAWFC